MGQGHYTKGHGPGGGENRLTSSKQSRPAGSRQLLLIQLAREELVTFTWPRFTGPATANKPCWGFCLQGISGQGSGGGGPPWRPKFGPGPGGDSPFLAQRSSCPSESRLGGQKGFGCRDVRRLRSRVFMAGKVEGRRRACLIGGAAAAGAIRATATSARSTVGGGWPQAHAPLSASLAPITAEQGDFSAVALADQLAEPFAAAIGLERTPAARSLLCRRLQTSSAPIADRRKRICSGCQPERSLRRYSPP